MEKKDEYSSRNLSFTSEKISQMDFDKTFVYYSSILFESKLNKKIYSKKN